MVFVGSYDYKLSDKRGKKLMVVVDGKKIRFGDSAYQHFRDKSGLLPKSSNHLDEKRRDNYLKRAIGLGRSTDPTSANYHAINVLW